MFPIPFIFFILEGFERTFPDMFFMHLLQFDVNLLKSIP